jgi:hypothetical protein
MIAFAGIPFSGDSDWRAIRLTWHRFRPFQRPVPIA